MNSSKSFFRTVVPRWPVGLLAALAMTQGAAAADAPVLDRVRIYPAAGKASEMVGGVIAGSNDGQTTGFEVLFRIESAPAGGTFTEIAINNQNAYRYVIYEGPNGSRGVVAEVEFYDGTTLLEGESFGVAGSFPDNGGGDFTSALDGNPTTFFEAPLENGAYVGYDLATPANTAPTPIISPAPGAYDNSQSITLQSEPGFVIRYTLDGSAPSATNGAVYSGPFELGDGRHPVRAIATSPTRFSSEVAGGLFLIGPDAQLETVSSYHIGNSLTDTFVNRQRLESVAVSAGYNPMVYKFTIPGAPTEFLWDNPAKGFGVRLPSGTNTNDVAAAFPEVAPLMHLTVQPFSGGNRPLDNETEHIGYFYDLLRQTSPDAQLWLYTQWPNFNFDDGFSKGKRLREIGLDHAPATTWEEGVRNHMRYFEILRTMVDDANDGPPVRIIPTALAFLRLKAVQERGELPGLDPTRFRESHWADEGQNIHTTDRGAYFVSLVVFSSIYGISPDLVNLPESSTGVTPAQDAVYKRVAWEAVRGYRWSMIPQWSGFNLWRETWFGERYTDEAFDWNRNDDGDDTKLLDEFALDLNPTLADSHLAPALKSYQPTDTATQFRIGPIRSDPLVKTVFFHSSDLSPASWQPTEDVVGASAIREPRVDKPGFDDWVVTPPSGTSRHFIRLGQWSPE